MIGLLTYPAATPALPSSAYGVRTRMRVAASSDRIWELHHIIANPASRGEEVKSAKRRLLHALTKSDFRFIGRTCRSAGPLARSMTSQECTQVPFESTI
jgi:hypothetical protein